MSDDAIIALIDAANSAIKAADEEQTGEASK
jgi:hypothetical protein